MSIKINKANPDPDYNFVATITDNCDRSLGKVFETHFEIELLQGERNIKVGGMIEYKMNISKEKEAFFLTALNQVIFKSKNHEN